jgi:DNA helicase HerA-like ATPase
MPKTASIRIGEVRAHQDFGAALRAEHGLPATKPLPHLVVPPALKPGDILLGEADSGGPIGIDLYKLIEGRLLVQGTSGAGKSWTLRRLLEQTAGRIQQIIVDPEGEFASIAEAYGYLVLDAARLDTAALAIAAQRVREHRISVLLDVSQVERDRQMQARAAFFVALIEVPREHWHTALVVIDEAHIFAPFGVDGSTAPSVRKASIGAMADMMSRGRKRGLCGILASSRLARLAKSAAYDIHNSLIGLNTLDLDIKRAAETIGWSARRAFDRLPMLSPGEFVGVGRAFSRSPAVMKVGEVSTKHRGATPALQAPTSIDRKDAARLLDLDELIEASARDAAILEGSSVSRPRDIALFIRDEGFSAAGRIFDALKPLAPEGAAVGDLAGHLTISDESCSAGLVLLDRYGVLDFSGEGKKRAVRLTKGILL